MAIAVRSRRHDRHQRQQRRKARQSKFKNRWFRRRIDIPEEPIRIHFQRSTEPFQDPWNPEDHYPWKKGAKHYIPKINKFTECAFEECLTCALREPSDFNLSDVQARRYLEDCYPKAYICLSAWVEEWHVIVERESEKKNDDGTPKTYTERLREKEFLREMKKEGYTPTELREMEYPRVFGFQGFIDFSIPAWDNDIGPIFDQVERFTRDGGYLVPMAYGCSNPECHEPFYSVATECQVCGSEEVALDTDEHGVITHRMHCNNCEAKTDLLEQNSEDLREKADTQYVCKECGTKGYPVPLLAKIDLESGEVDYSIPKEGWDTYDIYDVQLTIKKKRSSPDAPPKLVIDKWEIKDPDPKLFDPEQQGGGDTGKKIAEHNAKPLPLDTIHAPDLPDAQAKTLNEENVLGRKTPPRERSRAIRYAKPASNDEASETQDDDE